MILKPIENKAQFFELSQKHRGVFGSEEWLSIYGNSLQLVGVYDNGNKFLGGFFYMQMYKFGFSFIKLPPYSPDCGLFYISNLQNNASQNSFVKEIISEMCDYMLKLNPALIVLAFPSEIKDLQPFIWNKFKVVPNYTYRIDLKKELEEIFAHFDSKNRNAINKAMKENVAVTISNKSASELFNYFKLSLSTAGANVYENELKNIFTLFSNPTNSFALEAIKDNKTLGIVFCVHDSERCYYLLGGLNQQNKLSGVNNILIKESIITAKEKGCSIFDFEGSMLRGVEKFFRSFGGELFPFYTANKAKLPLELMLKFKKRELF